MEFIEVTAKNLSDAITSACQQLSVTSDRLYYEVIEEGSSGFLGIGVKPVVIKASVKEDKVEEKEAVKASAKEIVKEAVKETVKDAVKEAEKKVDKTVERAVEKTTEGSVERKAEKIPSDGTIEKAAEVFLNDVFHAMGMTVSIQAKYDTAEKNLDIDLSGDEMGVLIGKRGQTLDSLQYLVSLVVNKDSSDYIRVKVDTENYRSRRKETLENLAKNIAYKVKRTKRSVSLEPMNPYERRIIHSALQNDRYVTTHSEGDEPFRRVVVTLKRQ